jgi:cellulose 1,4-beta-cellobiosidase
VKTAWSIDMQGVSGTYNASYDVWFSTGAGGDPEAPSGGYLMVWYYKPPDAQPIGSILNDGHGVTIPGVSGTWDVWVGPNTGNANRPVISYVVTQPISDLEFDLNAFIQDAVKRPGALDASWYLSNVFAGFEIWSGGVGLKTKAFYAIVE